VSVYPPVLTPRDVWEYARRELTRYAKVYVLFEGFRYSDYTRYVSASSVDTAVGWFYLPLTYYVYGVYIPKTALGLTKLYAVVNYKLTCQAGGTASIYIETDAGYVVLDEVVNPPSLVIREYSGLVDLTSILDDSVLDVVAGLAGDGTNASSVELYHTIIFGVSE